jgi:hypothetical protein
VMLFSFLFNKEKKQKMSILLTGKSVREVSK